MKLVRFNKIAGAAAAALAVVSLVACDQNKKSQGPRKVVITAEQQMEAEELAQAGEQLISPTTFHLADKVFAMVLEKDPRNKKAQMYRAALKQFIIFKGVLARVRPLYVEHGHEVEYTRIVRQELRESPVKHWLLDGKEDIKTYEQIQDLMVQARGAAEDFRKYLLANPDLDLTIYMNEFVFQSTIDQTKRDCQVLENTDSAVIVECDDKVNAARRKMNSADVIMLRQALAGQVLYMTFLNSYSLAGLEDVLKPLEDIAKRKEAFEISGAQEWKEQLKIFDTTKGLGKLRKDHSFALLPAIGADFRGAVEWALKFQSELCPKGEGAVNRKGFVFEQGVCIQNDKEQGDARKILAYLTQALSTQGIVEYNETDDNGKNVRARVKAFAWAQSPVQDLRSILPNEVDECGNGKKWRDITFGGIFPDGDFEKLSSDDECRPNANSIEIPNQGPEL